jgi:hypothetical protein
MSMITFLIPTIGRPSLQATLESIELWQGDEILLVSGSIMAAPLTKKVRQIYCPPGKDWGHTERNVASRFALGQYIAHIDDDDTYAPGTRALMEDAIRTTPHRPLLFRMRYPNGVTLWREPTLTFGNVGTPMMLIPNEPDKFGTWGSFDGGDFAFLETMRWSRDDIVWRPEVTALLGHNSVWAEQQAAMESHR